MEIKTKEQIKEEVSKDLMHPYRTWIENARFSNDDNISVLEDSGAIDEAMTRYASQFQTNTDLITTEISVMQERIAELEDCLRKVVNDTDETSNPYLEITGETLVLIESLINKGK